MTSCEGLGTDYVYAWGGGGWELDLGPQSMWYMYILVLSGLQAIPFEMHTSVIFWVRVCVTGGIGVGGGGERGKG